MCCYNISRPTLRKQPTNNRTKTSMSSDTSCFKIFNYSLHNIFADEFCFQLPVYQRPYSWNEEHVEQLLDDLYTAFEKDSNDPNIVTDDYFLGSVVLAKSRNKKNSNDYDVIDGQQRLTTLFLFFIVAFVEKVKDIRKYIVQKGDTNLGLHPGLRLNVRPVDREFFSKNIAELKQLDTQDDDEEDGPRYKLDTKIGQLINEEDIEREIDTKFRDNIKLLMNFFQEKKDKDQKDKFVSYVLKRVKLIVISTESVDTAFRIFTTLNARGMELSPMDKFKSEVLTRISDDLKEIFGYRWEIIERKVGRPRFEQMFQHIWIFFKCKERIKIQSDDPYKSLLDLCQSNPNEFSEEFIKRAEDYCSICFVEKKNSDSYKFYIELMRRYEYQEWIPLALFIYATMETSQDRLVAFKALEKVVFLLCIIREHKSSRMKRFEQFMFTAFTMYESCPTDLAARLSEKLVLPLKPDGTTKKSFTQEYAFEVLRKEGIYNLSFCKEVLLRLDFLKTEANQVSYDTKQITIEHILPQTINSKEWEWHHSTHKANLHRLGNLALLSTKKNISAKNMTFAEKKKQYFCRNKVSTPFVTTRELERYADWKPEDFKHRHASFLKAFHSYYTPLLNFREDLNKHLKQFDPSKKDQKGTDEDDWDSQDVVAPSPNKNNNSVSEDESEVTRKKSAKKKTPKSAEKQQQAVVSQSKSKSKKRKSKTHSDDEENKKKKSRK